MCNDINIKMSFWEQSPEIIVRLWCKKQQPEILKCQIKSQMQQRPQQLFSTKDAAYRKEMENKCVPKVEDIVSPLAPEPFYT